VANQNEYKPMKRISLLLFTCFLISAFNQKEKGLKDYYHPYFPIGVAVSAESIKGEEGKFILQHFNSLTAENAMKMAAIHPLQNRYNWKDADSIVAFAVKNKLKVRGHTLCWHEQNPQWLFKHQDGSTVSRDTLLARLKDHIFKVVNRYKGKIYAWDVVNEAIDDDGNKFLRNTEWLQLIGEDYIAKAFEYAHEADPKALLFYNEGAYL
jgi:endo-1,4-beta-xylanase